MASGATCTSVGSGVQPSNSAGTWSCGHVPTSSDDIRIVSQVQLTGDLLGNNITIGYGPPNTAQLLTDGVSAHLVRSVAPIIVGSRQITHGLPAAATIDTCTGSAAGKEVTFQVTGALPGNFVLTHDANLYADISANLCHSIFRLSPGVGAVYELGTPLYGDVSSWSISTTELVGGGASGAFYMYAVPMLKISNVSWTGGSGAFVRFVNTPPGSCFITNATIINNSAVSQYMIEDYSGGYNPCVIQGMALETDPAGLHNQGLSGIASNISDSLEYNYYNLNGVTGNMAGIGASGNVANSLVRSTVTHNAIYGGNLNAFDFVDSSNNILFVNARSAPSQGGIFIDNHGCPFTSTGDIVAYDASYGADPGSVGVLSLSGINPACVTLRHLTVQMGSNSSGGYGVGMGEYSLSSPSELSDSIIVGAYNNIASLSAGNAFIASGTGGAGVFNNDNYDSVNPYVANGTHFDNGVTPHPSPVYGDTNFNPNFMSTTRGFGTCDSRLGGVGTVAHMFETVMYGRWTGAAPRYTASQVVECLRCAWLPANPAFKTASSTGGYIGAVSPTECACQ